MDPRIVTSRFPTWALVTTTFLLIMIGVGAALFGFAGGGFVTIGVEAKEDNCIFTLYFAQMSKSSDHAFGCLHYKVKHCKVKFGRACKGVEELE